MSVYRTRRSLKPFAMDPARAVPRELVAELLEDARWAPSHGLTQPWRFQVFASASARARLADGLQALYDELTPESARDPEKRAKLGAGLRLAPVAITLVAKIEPGGRIPEWEEIAAVSCAVQNILLSAHERGLGSFWSSPPVACSAAFARWLGHPPETHRALGLVYLGWPPPHQPAPRSTRAPLAERVVWHDV